MSDDVNLSSKEEIPRRRGRQKGCPKTGGRVKGTPNKNSWNLRQSLDAAGFDPAKEIINIISRTDDIDKKWDRLTFLMRFLYPQLKEIEAVPTSEDKPAAAVIPTEAEIKRLTAIASAK